MNNKQPVNNATKAVMVFAGGTGRNLLEALHARNPNFRAEAPVVYVAIDSSGEYVSAQKQGLIPELDKIITVATDGAGGKAKTLLENPDVAKALSVGMASMRPDFTDAAVYVFGSASGGTGGSIPIMLIRHLKEVSGAQKQRPMFVFTSTTDDGSVNSSGSSLTMLQNLDSNARHYGIQLGICHWSVTNDDFEEVNASMVTAALATWQVVNNTASVDANDITEKMQAGGGMSDVTIMINPDPNEPLPASMGQISVSRPGVRAPRGKCVVNKHTTTDNLPPGMDIIVMLMRPPSLGAAVANHHAIVRDMTAAVAALKSDSDISSAVVTGATTGALSGVAIAMFDPNSLFD